MAGFYVFLIGVKMRTKKGFTLIELLVVIAIIALLLAILMPSLRKAKQVAKDAICRSNLKHWAAIWHVYANENNGLLPDPTNPIIKGIRRDWIAALREDYPTGEGTISQCPMAPKYVEHTGPIPGGGGTFSAYRNLLYAGTPQERIELNSYGMNLFAYSKPHFIMNPAQDKNWGRLEVSGTSRSTIPLFMDSAFGGAAPHYDGTWDGMTMKRSEEPLPNNGLDHVYDGIRQFALPRHGSGTRVGVNVLFFDSSVSHVMVKEIWSLRWHKDFDTRRWETDRATIWPGDGTGIWLDRLSEDF